MLLHHQPGKLKSRPPRHTPFPTAAPRSRCPPAGDTAPPAAPTVTGAGPRSARELPADVPASELFRTQPGAPAGPASPIFIPGLRRRTGPPQRPGPARQAPGTHRGRGGAWVRASGSAGWMCFLAFVAAAAERPRQQAPCGCPGSWKGGAAEAAVARAPPGASWWPAPTHPRGVGTTCEQGQHSGSQPRCRASVCSFILFL